MYMPSSKEKSTAQRQAKINQREIAHKANVSISTVSRVLNNVAGISDDVRNRVLDTARQLGITMQAPAITVLRRVMVIAHFTRVQMNATAFYGPVLDGIVAESGRHGIEVSYLPIDSGAHAEAYALQQFHASPFDGVIFVGYDALNVIRHIMSAGTPILLANTELNDIWADCIVSDNEFAPRTLVRRLVELGHRRILRISYHGRATLHRRNRSFSEALTEAGITGSAAPVIEIPHHDAQMTYDKLKQFLKNSPERVPFTACVCATDPLAISAMQALQEHGLRIPEDVSVTGVNDEPMAALLSPSLSTIRVDGGAMGRLAMRRLIERAALPSLLPIQMTLSCPFIERASIGPAPQPAPQIAATR